MIGLAVMISTLAVVVLLFDLNVETKLLEGRVRITPLSLFYLKYAFFVLFPAIAIFYSYRWDSAFFTLKRYDNTHTLIATSIFYIVASGSLHAVPRKKKEQSPAIWIAPYKQNIAAAAVLLSGGVAIWLLTTLITGYSVTILAVQGLAAMDTTIFFDGYNDARYGMTKKAFLEDGVSGMGTLTALAALMTVSAVGIISISGRTYKTNLLHRYISYSLSFATAMNTGARGAILDWAIKLVLIRTMLSKRWQYKTVLTVLALMVIGVLAFTAITPKKNVGGAGLFAKFNRFAGNAFNDAVIIDKMSPRDRDSLSRFGVPVDVSVTKYLYSNQTVHWYETPTVVGSVYYRYGWIGIIIAASITGVLLISLQVLADTAGKCEYRIVNRISLGGLCWTAPISGVFVPKIFVSWLLLLAVLWSIDSIFGGTRKRLIGGEHE